MRIQETDRILKESRVARHAHAQEQDEQGSVLSKMMRVVTGMKSKLIETFKR